MLEGRNNGAHRKKAGGEIDLGSVGLPWGDAGFVWIFICINEDEGENGDTGLCEGVVSCYGG